MVRHSYLEHRSLRLLVGGSLLGLGLLGGGAAQAAAGPPGYLSNVSGDVVRDGSGNCIRTAEWSRERAIEECDPELVAKAAPQPEVAKTAPAPVPHTVRRRIALQTDTYFRFDSAQLTEDGKQKLQQLAQRISQSQNPQVQITGYTDPIGTEQYNQQLSEKRAQAVKLYLVEQGIARDQVRVAARGETDPVVQCPEKRGQALIQCLAPNRRSLVEFSAFEEVTRSGDERAPDASPAGTGPGASDTGAGQQFPAIGRDGRQQ